MSRFMCPKCDEFAGPTFRSVFRHIVREHQFEQGFFIRCGIEGCQATFTKMSSWNKHINRKHKGGIYIYMYIGGLYVYIYIFIS